MKDFRFFRIFDDDFDNLVFILGFEPSFFLNPLFSEGRFLNRVSLRVQDPPEKLLKRSWKKTPFQGVTKRKNLAVMLCTSHEFLPFFLVWGGGDIKVEDFGE